MEKKVYRSRISVLLLAVIIFALLIPMSQCKTYDSLVPVVIAFVLVIFIFGGIRYVVSENYLYLTMWNIIQTGKVNIADIISVERSYNPISSAAASLKRLYVSLNENSSSFLPYWLISPVKELEFIEDLKVINPYIYIDIPSDENRMWRIWDWDI